VCLVSLIGEDLADCGLIRFATVLDVSGHFPGAHFVLTLWHTPCDGPAGRLLPGARNSNACCGGGNQRVRRHPDPRPALAVRMGGPPPLRHNQSAMTIIAQHHLTFGVLCWICRAVFQLLQETMRPAAYDQRP